MTHSDRPKVAPQRLCYVTPSREDCDRFLRSRLTNLERKNPEFAKTLRRENGFYFWVASELGNKELTDQPFAYDAYACLIIAEGESLEDKLLAALILREKIVMILEAPEYQQLCSDTLTIYDRLISPLVHAVKPSPPTPEG